MKKILFTIIILLFSTLGWAQTITLRPDGILVLENRFLTVHITPEEGGRVISFIDRKTGEDFAGGAWDLGMGGEMNWQERSLKRSDWYGKPFRYEILREPNEAVVIFQRDGVTGSMQWLTVEKIYRLKKNSSRLQISYQFKVNSNAMSELVFCPWLHNSAQVKGKPGILSFATTRGVERIDFNPGSPANESFHYDLADGWFAFTSPENRNGVIFQTPYRDLMCFYNWQGSAGNTMEILYRSQRIPNGESYQTQLDITLFHGFLEPDGIIGNWVGKLSADQIQLYAAGAAQGNLELSLRKLPGHLETKLMSQEVTLAAGENTQLKFSVPPQSPGTYELICRIQEQGTEKITLMTTPLKFGSDAPAYQRSPESRRNGSDTERFGQTLLNAAERQDCYAWDFGLPLQQHAIPWLKPYTGGKIKMLILTDMRCGREVIELAARMDAEAVSCSFSGNGVSPWNPTWGHSGGLNETNIYLSELLKQKFDVIVLAGIQIKSITSSNLKLISEQVNRGTGLVSVMPTEIPSSYQSLFPAAPLIKPVYQRTEPKIVRSASFQAASDTFLAPMPFDALPEILIFPYTASLPAISTNGMPFFVTGNCGNGRTALFTWLTGRPDNTTWGGIMPAFSAEASMPWQDYYYGMLIKAILWSANRLPELQIKSIVGNPQKLTVTLNNRTNESHPVELQITARHHSRISLGNRKIEFALPPGAQSIEIPLDFWLMAGKNFLDLRLSCKGLAADFGAIAIEQQASVKIKSINAPSESYQSNSVIPVAIELDGNLAPEMTLQASCYDRLGRLLAEGTEKISSPSSQIELKLPELYSQYGYIKVKLFQSDRQLDQSQAGIDLLPRKLAGRNWDDYLVMMSWPVRDTRALPFYLRDAWAESMRELGVDMIMQHGIPVYWGHDPAKYALMYRSDFMLVMESMSRISVDCRLPYYQRPTFDYRWRQNVLKRLMENYSRTHDHKYLHRDPVLDNPDFLREYAQALQRWLPNIRHWRPFMYDLGDELSYGNFSNPIDFDFSPESLQQFRQWLRGQYSSLEQLSKEWRRDFKNWDEVIPDTAFEARQRQIYTAWGMHRTYNAQVFTNFLKTSTEAIRTADPGSRVTMSGTQEPKSYNGYDWSQLMPLIDSLTVYSMNAMPEIFRSFKKIPMMGWVGYGSSKSDIWYTIWDNAFNGHFGIGIYNEMSVMNPDLTLTPRGRQLQEAIRPLKDGIGILLFESEQEQPEIAIHYSQQSAVASWIGQEEGDFSASRLAWVELFKMLGYHLKFITTAEIEQDILLTDRYKVFVMPYSLALSDQEAKAINTFAGKGGLVLADIEPGRYNSRFNLEPLPRLKLPGAIILKKKLDSNIKTNQYSGLFRQLKSTLEQRQVKPAQQIVTIQTGAIELHAFRLSPQGGQIITGWCRQSGKAHFQIPPGYSLYNVLDNQQCTENESNLSADRPYVWVCVPYQVTGMDLEVIREADHYRLRAQVKATSGQPFRHVVRFEITGNDGKLLRHYSKVCNAPDGKAEHVIYPALNDTGEWQIKAIDIISGTTKTIKLSMKGTHQK